MNPEASLLLLRRHWLLSIFITKEVYCDHCDNFVTYYSPDDCVFEEEMIREMRCFIGFAFFRKMVGI